MAQPIRTSIAIIGGGCAGMSLAARLAEANGPDCIVLEAAPNFQGNRTWCFWDNGQASRWNLETDFSWPAWSLRKDGKEIVHRGSSYSYSGISGESFFRQQTAKIQASSNVRVILNSPVAAIKEDGALVFGPGEAGLVEADLIVDTRPVSQPDALLQHFLGWEVIVDEEIFDPTKAILMDFDVPQDRGLHFFYVLPFSAKRALVEATVLSPSVWQRKAYEEALLSYLKDRFRLEAEQFQIIRRESGVLPMARRETENSENCVLLGTVAGAMKASSGYAFPFIQSQADAMAESILGGQKRPRTLKRGRLTAFMDDLFVEVLRRTPQRAPSFFRDIFFGTDADQFARFMMDDATMADRLAIVRSLPPGDFLAALVDRVR
ncbi:lycopene cyclase family protein [Nisaea sp.]|uniref:lycopene cyclase family protein n=1 Tax=Nisaea sp. TaxID=2024842 RepID=UPI0032ED5EA7